MDGRKSIRLTFDDFPVDLWRNWPNVWCSSQN